MCRLFKVLQTNACRNNCTYCAYRRDRSCTRVATTPDEMAEAFDTVHKKRLVDGLFLSSGITRTPEHTMSKMIDTAHILRNKYKYPGYIHLKIMPGTPTDCIRESLRVSNRVSLNIESPTETDLLTLSPDKSMKDGFFKTLMRIKSEIDRLKSIRRRVPSLTTQFVVGAGNEKDMDIIKMTNLLYKEFGLWRVFYSAFRPVPETPLQEKPPESPWRQNRLYQADFLMRFYKFAPSDLPLREDGNLYEGIDPKLLWAQQNPEFFPVDINNSDYWTL
ncbi:radical SAM protein, partial [bacterium]|nr:radical SAM protein [bacterium]